MSPEPTHSFLSGWRFPDRPYPERQPHLAAAVRRLRERAGEVEGRVPDRLETERILREVTEGWRASGTLASTLPRHVRRLCSIYFDHRDRREFVELVQPGFEDALQAWARARPTGASVRGLTISFLRSYPSDPEVRVRWGRYLKGALRERTGRRECEWVERSDRFGLMEEDGAAAFAELLLDQGAGSPALLEKAGFTGVLAGAGFLRESLVQATGRLESRVRLSTSLDCSQLEQWVATFTGPDGAVRFDELKPGIAEALLRPWLNVSPSSDVRGWVTAFVVTQLGDPRFRQGAWVPVAPEVRALLRRWLVRSTLEEFFDLIDATARDDHWRDRRAFWTRYVDADLIDDARLVLGTEARSRGRGVIGQVGDGWAILRGATASHSALILRIAGATILEWSHAGAVRCWPKNDERAPSLTRKVYTGSSLRAECSMRTEHRPPGIWQSRVATWIRQETGVRP